MRGMLESYIDAFRPIILIEDFDFCVVDAQIMEVANGAKIYEFSNGYGTIEFMNGRPRGEETPSLVNFLSLHKDIAFPAEDESPGAKVFLVLKDIHESLKDQRIIAQLRHIAEATVNKPDYHTVIFIVSGTRIIPKELEHFITLVPANKPKQEVIEDIIKAYANDLGFTIDPEDVGPLALDLKGLSHFQIRQTLNLAYCNGGCIAYGKDKGLIFDEKRQMIEKSGLLEFIRCDDRLEEVGGLGSLKSWLRQKSDIFENLDEALKAGVDRPRGALILGVPGCGKSLTAKTTASLFQVPLVRLDVGRLLGKYVGESEGNMRAALALAESISPCILWIDEIEKAFAGGTGNGHEVTVRLIGQFLTWMQEKKNTVFVVATANNIASLPPEFLRKGRFDEIFSVDLPDKDERREIFKIHLKKRGQYSSALDLTKAVSESEQFSGADIESAVATAVEAAFVSGRKLVTTDDLIEAVKQTNPLAKSLNDEIKALREKLKTYSVRPAKGDDTARKPVKPRKKRLDPELDESGQAIAKQLFPNWYWGLPKL